MDLKELKKTYCNPLPLPNYPQGRPCRKELRDNWGWIKGKRSDFRETADPSVVYYKGKWYLYPSCGMAYITSDFIHWTHHPLNCPDIGYAPTVALFRNKFYLTACDANLWVSDSPLGPFKNIGPMADIHGAILKMADPMIFADEGGKLYIYWGIGPGGIRGAALDPNFPNKLTSEIKVLFKFNPEHIWERLGDSNEDPTMSYVEGAWMLKHGKKYFLTYAAPGTELKTYAMGTYVSHSPLGPFKYQKRNPILRNTEGLVHGPGHGSIVKGPKGTIWAFYTCLVRNLHYFERRIGMDPAGFDKNGNLFVLGSSDTPQLAPGLKKHPEHGNSAGLIPVTINRIPEASSWISGHEPVFALDDSLRTSWQAAKKDKKPWLRVNFRNGFIISAARIQWAEPGLDYQKGILPGPVKYKLEISTDGKKWRAIVDKSNNKEDMLIDYRVFKPVFAKSVKLTILSTAKGITPAVLQMTVFGDNKTIYNG